MTGRAGRSAAEWVTFALSCIVLSVVIGLIVLQAREPRDPAAPVATVSGPVRTVEGQFHVDVTVRNTGALTAANVQVIADLAIEGTSTTADQTIDFLAGGEDGELVFVFADDPSGGELKVDVSGFARP